MNTIYYRSKFSGLQTWIGLEEVKSEIVFFHVVRNSTFREENMVMPFDMEILNVGDAFNLTSGVFTAPRSGTYFFSFISSVSDTYYSLYFDLQLNGNQIATCNGPFTVYRCYITSTVQLSIGDEIRVFHTSGRLVTANFFGWLVVEDVFS